MVVDLDFKRQPVSGKGSSAYLSAHYAADAVDMRVRKISMIWAVKNRKEAEIFEDKVFNPVYWKYFFL